MFRRLLAPLRTRPAALLGATCLAASTGLAYQTYRPQPALAQAAVEQVRVPLFAHQKLDDTDPRFEEAPPAEDKKPKRFKLFTGNSNPKLAQEIADELGCTMGKATVSHFEDGEGRWAGVPAHTNPPLLCV
jgi:hypothetical protein